MELVVNCTGKQELLFLDGLTGADFSPGSLLIGRYGHVTRKLSTAIGMATTAWS